MVVDLDQGNLDLSDFTGEGRDLSLELKQ